MQPVCFCDRLWRNTTRTIHRDGGIPREKLVELTGHSSFAGNHSPDAENNSVLIVGKMIVSHLGPWRQPKSPNRVGPLFNTPGIMKKAALVLTMLLTVVTSFAEPFGQITINSCYQSFTTSLGGGTYKVIGNNYIQFGSTNPLDFHYFRI